MSHIGSQRSAIRRVAGVTWVVASLGLAACAGAESVASDSTDEMPVASSPAPTDAADMLALARSESLAASADDQLVPPPDVALDLFASVYGDIPGGSARVTSIRPGDGSLAIRMIGAHWSELTPAQRSAIEALVVETRPSGWRSNGRVPPETAATIDELAETLATHLGTSLAAELDVVVSNAAVFRNARVLADAAPLRRGRLVWSGTADRCQIRIAAGTAPSRTTLAHELMHCFQFEAAPLETVARLPDWIVEGSAEWAAAEVAGGDDTTSEFYVAWQQTEQGLFELDYPAVGYFWTIQTLGVDPWDEIPWIISQGYRASDALPALLSRDELFLRLATGSLRSGVFGIDVEPIWDLTPPAVPGASNTRGQTVRFGQPATARRDGAALSHLQIHRFEVIGHAVVVQAEGSVGALEASGRELRTWSGDAEFTVCFEDDGPHELFFTAARGYEAGPLGFTLTVPRPEQECVEGPIGRWIVQRALVGGVTPSAVIEITAGADPNLYVGREIAVNPFDATDCPAWGDLFLSERIADDDPRLILPPDGDVDVVAAWSGSMGFWCMEHTDPPSEIVVAALSDGRLVFTFPGPAPTSVVLTRW